MAVSPQLSLWKLVIASVIDVTDDDVFFLFGWGRAKPGLVHRAYYSWGADLRDEKHAPCLSDERVRFVTVKWLLNRFPCDKHYEYNTSE